MSHKLHKVLSHERKGDDDNFLNSRKKLHGLIVGQACLRETSLYKNSDI